MKNTESFVPDFTDIRTHDLPLVGGKGANLGEMAAAGFPVPPGFCLTTAAFHRFMETGSDMEKVYSLLDSAVDVETVRIAGPRVREILLKNRIPEEVAIETVQAWQKSGREEAYAVRSSATAEDLPDASFAGQQDTYLNIIGETALLDAVRRCWVSLFTDRAILYRRQNNFSHRNVALSVVIQKMVMSEKSGIMFTADPLTGHRHTLTIDAGFGLGEALVGGLVTPDSYRVDKRTHTIIEHQITDKQAAIFPEKGGGTRQVSLNSLQREQTVLTDNEILSLNKLGCQIESHYGKPQDIEWAIADGHIYLLQTRPITSLYPIDALSSPDDTLHIFFSMGHQQNMTRAMAPLSLSGFPKLLPLKQSPDKRKRILRICGGRIFVDITPVLRHPIGRRIYPALLAQFDTLGPKILEIVMQRPEFRRSKSMHLPFKSFKLISGILCRVFRSLRKTDLTGFAAKTNIRMDAFISEKTHRLNAYPQGKEQIKAVMKDMSKVFPFFMHWVPEAAAGIIAVRLLPKLARRWLPKNKVEALTLGIPGNVVTEMNLALNGLASLARQSPQLIELFNHLGSNAHTSLSDAAHIEGSAPFLQAFKKFLNQYGARGPSEIDIMMKRWNENPMPVLSVIAENISRNVDSRAQFKDQAEKRETAFNELLKASGHGLLRSFRVRMFRRLYHVLTETGGMREHHKFLMVRYMWIMKQILQKNAVKLVSEGKITDPDDIWFLTWEELLKIWEDTSTDWISLVVRRRIELKQYQKLTPSLILTSDGETPVVHHHIKDAPPGALLGNPVSPGVIEGPAHVILDPAAETLQPGEILVAPFTDPGWTPLFINAAGLVMNIGGALTHGSVVAREYGIPAVTGVRDATKKLQTGQLLRVDGNRGIIEILQ